MGLLDDRQRGLLAMQHNIDPRYKAASRAPAAQVLRGLLAPQQMAEMALAFAPGSGDAMAVRDGQQNFADMRKSIEGGDYGKAASDAIYGTTAYVSALPVLGAAIPHFGGMFAGKGAKTADLVALRKAEDLEKAGGDADAIWRDTGWGRGADGEWRFEIDDSGARLTEKGNQEAAARAMSELVDHTEAYAAYPDLADVSTRFEPISPSRTPSGSYTAPENREHLDLFDISEEIDVFGVPERLSTGLHEAQHAAQYREGFARGASPREYARGPMFDDKAKSLQGDLSKALTGDLMHRPDDILRDIRYLPPDELSAIVRKHGFDSAEDAMDFLRYQDEKRTPFSQYHRTSGEVEARNVEARMDWTPEQRRETPPWHTEDVPRDQQIVRRGLLDDGPQMSLPDAPGLPMGEASRMARADKFKSNDLPSILDDLGYKYKVENSQFMSDRHGPSPSSYYTVETPLGTKRFRVSDHEDAAINPNQTYLFLGRDVNEQKKAAFDALGIAVPEDVADGVLATQAKRAELARARDAAETNRKMDAKSQIDDALNAFGAGHLTGRAKRQAIAALNMRSERRKKDTIAEILARNPPN